MQNRIKKLASGRRWLWIAGAVIVIGIALFAYTRFATGARRARAQTDAQTARIQTGDISGTITASGHIQAHQSVSLSLQTSGVVKEVDVKVGDKVTAGQTLLKLDDANAQLSLLGGVLGTFIGWGVSRLIGPAVNVTAVVDAGTVVLANGVAALTGLVFGIYPAWRAARLHPIEALRYE